MKFFVAAIFATTMSYNALAKDEMKKPTVPQAPQAPKTPQQPMKPELKPTQGQAQPQAPAQGQAPAQAPKAPQAPVAKVPQAPVQVKEPLKEQQAECLAKDLVDIDQEEMELFQKEELKGKKADIPESVVLRVNTKTGVQSLHYPKQNLQAGNVIPDNDVEEIEAWDGANMETGSAALVLDRNHGSRWHFNRTRGHNWRHTYNFGHPYSSYYGWNYGPTYTYNRYYDRPYRFSGYRYRPYYSYGLGGHIYRFFRRILD